MSRTYGDEIARFTGISLFLQSSPKTEIFSFKNRTSLPAQNELAYFSGTKFWPNMCIMK